MASSLARLRAALVVLVASGAIAGCNCATDTLQGLKTCQTHPEMQQCQQQTQQSCDLGTVSGRVCAPDMHTFVGDATVSATGVCNGQPFSVQTSTDAQGNFSMKVPAGMWTLHAVAGSFQRDYDVTVAANSTTAIPDDQLCFQQNAARLAVITGEGDHIETLLTGLGFHPTLFDGGSGFDNAGGGKSLLTDLNKLKQFDVLFIDCGAGRPPASSIDFGSDTNTIAQNLQAFVAGGGSLYASDWAFIYVHLAYPEFHWVTLNGSVNMPFDTRDLMGYAPQSITADVADFGLRNVLNKSQVTIDFPSNSSAKSTHWALMDTTSGQAKVLISGPATECESSDNRCQSQGKKLSSSPLAVLLQVKEGQGGAVVFTSFHNISQSTQDVGEILKYLIFKL